MLIIGKINIILFTSFLLIGSRAQSQSFLKVFLIDRKTNKPIPYATIKVLHKPFGTFTNEKGEFEIEASSSDTLLITSIGYSSTKIVHLDSDTIFLAPHVKELQPIVVTRLQYFSTQIMGINEKAEFQWGSTTLGEEFAQKIRLNLAPNEYCQIKKLIFSVRNFGTEVPTLVHAYSVDTSTGKPGSELLTRNHFITRQHFKKGKIIVDISDEQLYVDDDSIFVSFQWLGYEQNNRERPKARPTLNMTNALDERLTYSRTLCFPDYGWFPALHINKKITNTIFQIQVDRFKN